MKYDESGAVVKSCAMCGKEMHIENYFAAVPRKYCERCANEVKREKTAECLRELRRKTREENKIIREHNKALGDENMLLRQKLRETMARVEELQVMVGETAKKRNGI